MSETCKNCPITTNDVDAPLLCAAVARMVDIEDPVSGRYSYSKSAMTPEEIVEDARDKTYEDALEELGFSPQKIAQVQKCARKILWNECDFHRSAENL